MKNRNTMVQIPYSTVGADTISNYQLNTVRSSASHHLHNNYENALQVFLTSLKKLAKIHYILPKFTVHSLIEKLGGGGAESTHKDAFVPLVFQ